MGVNGVIKELAKYEKEIPTMFMEYCNEYGQTLLMTACKFGHFGLTKYLLRRYMEYKDAIFNTVSKLILYMVDLCLCCCYNLPVITSITNVIWGNQRLSMPYPASIYAE